MLAESKIADLTFYFLYETVPFKEWFPNLLFDERIQLFMFYAMGNRMIIYLW